MEAKERKHNLPSLDICSIFFFYPLIKNLSSVPRESLFLLCQVNLFNIYEDKVTSTVLLEGKSDVKHRNLCPQHHDSLFIHEAPCLQP